MADPRRSIALAPAAGVTLQEYALLHLNAGRLEDALPWLGRAVAADPSDPSTVNDLGLVLRATGRLAAARRVFESMVQTWPDIPEAHGNLGLVLAEDDHAELAPPTLRRAIALRPEFTDAYNNCGNALIRHRRPADAISMFRRAVILSPTHVEALNGLAGALRLVGEIEGAVAALDRAIEIQPAFIEAYNNLGLVLRRLGGDRDAALRHLAHRNIQGRSDSSGPYHATDAARVAAGRGGYLVIHQWGCGFWGEINHVAVQILAAHLMGRTPIVRWGADSRYAVPGRENAWEVYYRSVSGATPADLANPALSWFPSWQRLEPSVAHRRRGRVTALSAFNRAEDVVVVDGYSDLLDVLAWAPEGHPLAQMPPAEIYLHLFEQHIHLVPELLKRVDDAASRLKHPVLAVHYRNQAQIKIDESLDGRALDVDAYVREIDAFLASQSDGSVFLLCDYRPALDALSRRYGERLFSFTDFARVDREEEIEATFNNEFEGYRLATEVILDAYVAAKCDWFLGDGASGVTCGILNLKRWPADRVRLLRQNVFLKRGPSVTKHEAETVFR